MSPILKPGDVFRSFRVERFAGAGAHFEVYAVRNLLTYDARALKVTQLADHADAPKIARLLVAARGACAIRHPNVEEVYDLGCERDGTVYLVGELLQGGTIERVLRWGRCSAVFALSVAIEAAKGLAASHLAMVVHRDVKPSNLFLMTTEDPRRTRLKVLDYSLAKVLSDEGVQTTAGRRGGLGTPAYMAPEQLAGAPPHPTMDVYALGTTLYEMLAGRHPFHAELADRAALVDKQRHAMPPPLAEIAGLPPRVDAVVSRALAKDPEARYRTISELALALFELRAWLVQEDRASNVVLPVPADEPPIPGDVNPYEVGVPQVPPSLHGFELPDPAATLPLGGSLQALLPPIARTNHGDDR